MVEQIVIKNQLISYLYFGNGAGRQNLIFLHGWRSQKEIWNQVINSSQLTAKGLQLYAIDLPGFGQSPAPREPWTVGDYAQVLEGFIKKLNLENVIIIGHSFGGRVGIKFTANYPDLISKLALVDSAGFVVSSKSKNSIRTLAKIARPLFKPKIMQGLRKKIYKQIGAEDYLATPDLQKTFVNVVNEDLTEDMRRIQIPTLIMWGENDKETPLVFGQKMKSEIRSSKFEILENAGHYSFLDKPQEFISKLSDFID